MSITMEQEMKSDQDAIVWNLRERMRLRSCNPKDIAFSSSTQYTAIWEISERLSREVVQKMNEVWGVIHEKASRLG